MKNWLVILALLSTNSVFAAKTAEWIWVGEHEKEQVYIDMNSRRLEGDIAHAQVRVGSWSLFLLDYDCKRRTVVDWIGPDSLTTDSLLHSVGAKACKRSWQIWK